MKSMKKAGVSSHAHSNQLPRVICVVGPTASGKTSLGIRLAKEFEGEVINADSRQVYKDFAIGTGIPPGKSGFFQKHRAYLSEGVPHYLMDFLDPLESYSVVEWKDKALQALEGIVKRKHLPVIVGGTGLYLRALIDNLSIPKVEPNPTMRKALEEKPLSELVAVLLKIDPFARHAVDLKNPRRVIRAIEVATFTGKPFTAQQEKGKPLVEALQIGRRWTREQLNTRIDAAVEDMVKRGWIDEIRAALKKGIPEDAPAMTSIGYREMSRAMRKEISLEDAVRFTKDAVHQYAKRQMTWFNRDKRICWVDSEEEAIKLAKEFLG
jgi:tRNA dimethylallyltransferase